MYPFVFVCVEYCGCLNGGWCQEEGRCDCAQFQGLGDRCQISKKHTLKLYSIQNETGLRVIIGRYGLILSSATQC